MDNYEKIKNLIDHKKYSEKQKDYAGKTFDSGYHALNLKGLKLDGQRDPAKRTNSIPIDFTNKTVLDIGCNSGGILFSIQDKIKHGVGVDYDYKIINFANKVAKTENYDNIDFYTFDLDSDDFDNMNYYSNEPKKYDVIFLLAVCMWIEKWPELIEWVRANCDICIFETNGNRKQQDKQQAKLRTEFKSVELLDNNSADDVGYLQDRHDTGKSKKHPGRSLYICR